MSSTPLRKQLHEAWGNPLEVTRLQRLIQQEKPLLRNWYEEIYRCVAQWLTPGSLTVELGSGSSFLADHVPGLITSNILALAGNDLVFDAQQLPFRPGTVDNLALINVMHHLPDPAAFLQEAGQALRPGGRVVIWDPHVSPLSYIPWVILHPENCNLSRPGYDPTDHADPLTDANSATCTLLFARSGGKELPGTLKLLRVEFASVCDYWLAGGYNHPQFLPSSAWPMLQALERILRPLGRLLASYMLVVLQKEAG